MIPLDGEIVAGEVTVNQASLTGESMPVVKRPGAKVYAGTVIEEGDGVIEVTQPAGESRYDKIVSMIEQSEQLKSAAESHAANLADKLVPYTLTGSALSYALTRNVTRALSVLMVDFSCALKLAMPLAVLSAMREASTYHITVKGGKFLEALSEADTIVFDKTGTLTHACPVVAASSRSAVAPNDMLRVAACLEEHFPHSMANAVVRAARERNLAHEEMHSQVEYIVAHGISQHGERREGRHRQGALCLRGRDVHHPRGRTGEVRRTRPGSILTCTSRSAASSRPLSASPTRCARRHAR